MNDNNLKPFNTLTESEQREIASKGGKASVKSRAEKKAARDIADAILSMPIKAGSVNDIDDAASLEEILQSNPSVKAEIIAKLAAKALEGNIKAIETLFTINGEYNKSISIMPTDNSATEIDLYFSRRFNNSDRKDQDDK